MMKSDPYLARIEAFNLKNGGGVTIKKVQNGYNLYLTATDCGATLLVNMRDIEPRKEDDRFDGAFLSP